MLIKNNKKLNTPLTPEHLKAIESMEFFNKLCNVEELGATGMLGKGPQYASGGGSSLNYTYLYHYNKSSHQKYSKLLSNIINILNHFFGTFYSIISRPIFLFTQNKLVIFINYYKPQSNSSKIRNRHIWKYNRKPSQSAKGLNFELQKLARVLAKFLNLQVELQLNKLVYPYHDSNILAKLIALNSNTRRFRNIMKIIIRKAKVITDPKNALVNTNVEKVISPAVSKDITVKNPISKTEEKDNNKFNLFKNFNKFSINRRTIFIHKTIPTILTGLKVKVSGRLATDRIIPKRTTISKEIGSFKIQKSNLVDYAIYTNKNKRGSYSVKVWTTSKICAAEE